MLNLRPLRTKDCPHQHPTILVPSNKSSRWVLWLAIASSSCLSWCLPVLADIPKPNTKIENTATGTFVDEVDPTSPQNVSSNTVSVSYAEVTGIDVSVPVATEAPATILNPGDYQGDGRISRGDLVYYDFTITNTGNDPTQFFIPGIAAITGGTIEPNRQLQIVSYTGSLAGFVPVNVPANGARTGPNSLGSVTGLLGTSGIFAQGQSITVRVPVRVSTATNNSSVTVHLGNSGILQNQAYIASAVTQVYTIDNPDSLVTDETTGTPANGEREGSNEAVTTLAAPLLRVISGTVFDDVNYGGGAGRDYLGANAAAGGFTPGQILRGGVVVELYKNGTLLGTTTTDGQGFYKFARLATDDTSNYTVRVVDSTVTSVRGTGGLAVQTFRTTNVGGTGLTGIVDRVGGEQPQLIDAPANSLTNPVTFAALDTATGQKIQSPAAIDLKSTGTDVSLVDFGFNFDTIVNKNDAGQGSLRQFIINSNALPNTNLAQSNQTPGKEVSIFMIPAGTTKPGLNSSSTNQLATSGGNVNAIAIQLTTALPAITAADTSIDATTQTTNVGNTNTGATTGAINPLATAVNRPEIAIDLSNTTLTATSTANRVIMRGFAFYNGSSTGYAIESAANNGTFTGLYGGTTADGNRPSITQATDLGISNQSAIDSNYFAYSHSGIVVNNGAAGTTITNNTIFSEVTAGIRTSNVTGVTIFGNNISGMKGTTTPQLGVGIQLDSGSQQIKIGQNSTYQNTGLGIDFGANGVTPNNSPASGINEITTGATVNPMNYPVITSNTVSADGKTLRVKGYVGIPGQTTSPFSGAVIELFRSDKLSTSTDDSGEVILGDALNRSHGEGELYLGTAINGSSATVNPDGSFDFFVDVTGKLARGNGITMTATLSNNTSEFSPITDPFKTPAKLLVVKRITRVGNLDLSNITEVGGISYDPNNPQSYDSNSLWPSGYIKGKINATIARKIQPGEEIEYTLYFMNVGEQDAQRVKICDFITPNQTYISTGYNPAGANDGGYGDIGMELAIGTQSTLHLSGSKDPDRGEYLFPNESAPTKCQDPSNPRTNNTGMVIIDVTKVGTFNFLPPALTQGAANSYGQIRFKTKVQ